MKILYINGNFVVSDMNSKFGTLVLVKNELKIHPNEYKTVQIGRTVLKFTVKDILTFEKEREELKYVESKKIGFYLSIIFIL